MKGKHNIQPVSQSRTRIAVKTFLLLVVTVVSSACNLPFAATESEKGLSDPNARMYQMYFDTSADPAQNELQTRRFLGHLHLADIEAIFGDIQSLPMDEDCNYIGGPVLDDEGTSWFATITPDLVGVNLVSVSPDGTKSSAFDLDGDRVVDILDMRFSDNRRVSFVTELMGLEVFREWLQGRDPFCNTEVARQLGLPDLGCNERGDGSSGGGGGSFAGSGIIDIVDMICSEYDTGPRADFMARNPNRAIHDERYTIRQMFGNISAVQETTDHFGAGEEYIGTTRVTTYIDVANNDNPAVVIVETVDSNGNGWRVTTTYNADGTSDTERQGFTVSERDRGKPNYSGNETRPPSGYPSPQSPDSEQGSTGQVNNDGNEQDDQSNDPSDSDSDGTWMDRNNPGPEGSDLIVSEFCRNRANHRSGIEEATNQDPTAINLSCGDLVGAPNSGNCNIIEWARPEDFNGVLEPPAGENGCTFEDPDRRCEGPSIEDHIRRFIGLNAELWSLDLPERNLCPPFLCDPAQSVELQTYTAGGIEFTCPVTTEATLEPSEENCPPGTYYAPVTNRCIAIQIPQGGGGNGGNGGNDGAGGTCNLSTSACTGQGLSFDLNKCECVPIQ